MWGSSHNLLTQFANGVQSVLLEGSQYPQLSNHLCDYLSLANPARFPRYGQHPIAVTEALFAILNSPA